MYVFNSDVKLPYVFESAYIFISYILYRGHAQSCVFGSSYEGWIVANINYNHNLTNVTFVIHFTLLSGKYIHIR